MGNVSTLENLLKQNIELTTALLNQESAFVVPEIVSPNSSPAISQLSNHEERLPTISSNAEYKLVTSPSGHVCFIPSHDMGGDSDLLGASQVDLQLLDFHSSLNNRAPLLTSFSICSLPFHILRNSKPDSSSYSLHCPYSSWLSASSSIPERPGNPKVDFAKQPYGVSKDLIPASLR